MQGADIVTAVTGDHEGTTDRSRLAARFSSWYAVDSWTWIRRGAGLAFVLVLLAMTIANGVPTARPTIAVLIIVGLAITRLGHGWRALLQVLFDWLPFTFVLLAYDRTRSIADTIGMPLHEADVVRWDRWIGFDQVPTVRLQHLMYNPAHVYWYDALCTLVYTSHFLATPVLAAVLWVRDRAQWIRFISRVIVLSVAGLATYILFPAAPPWFAARDHLMPPVVRLSARGWEWFHIGNLSSMLAKAQQDGANPVAAMPSLHTAFATLVALFVAGRLRSRWRWLLVLYPCAMGFALVYMGEHYVVDLAAGALYALVVHLLLNRWEHHRAERRRPADPSERRADADGTARGQLV